MNTPRRLLGSARGGGLALALLVPLPLLGGCVALPELGGTSHVTPEGAASEQPATPDFPDSGTEDAPRTQAESCDWDAPKLSATASGVPQATDGELQTTIVGAWQHTHFDTGGGYEAVEADIRYVFPSSDRILYCQHVPGVTEHAENAADFVWDETRIVLPGAAPGYVVVSWDADAMVWLNRADNSHYLLQRR